MAQLASSHAWSRVVCMAAFQHSLCHLSYYYNALNLIMCVSGTAAGHGDEIIVQLKNILLCGVLDTKVHPTVVKSLADTPIESVLVEWLGSMARYSDEIDRLCEDGALPDGWVSVDVGPRDAAARMLRLWDKMRMAAAASPDTVTHRDIFQAALPLVFDFYEHVVREVRLEMTDETPASEAVLRHVYFGRPDLAEHDRVLRWL
jgi:hypothetical protein